jgi:hypothetical protein
MQASWKRVLRKIFGPKREEIKETGENCIVSSFMVCTAHQTQLIV